MNGRHCPLSSPLLPLLSVHFILLLCPHLYCLFIVVLVCLCFLWGHPFMTSTRRGGRVRLRWMHVDGRKGVISMWSSTLKIRIRVCSDTILSSCHASFFSKRNWSLDGIKSGKLYATSTSTRRVHLMTLWAHVDRERGSKTRFSWGRHKWMTPFPSNLACNALCRILSTDILLQCPNNRSLRWTTLSKAEQKFWL